MNKKDPKRPAVGLASMGVMAGFALTSSASASEPDFLKDVRSLRKERGVIDLPASQGLLDCVAEADFDDFDNWNNFDNFDDFNNWNDFDNWDNWGDASMVAPDDGTPVGPLPGLPNFDKPVIDPIGPGIPEGGPIFKGCK